MADATNIIVKQFNDEFVIVRAKKGYILYSVRLGRAVSEAVVKPEQVKYFEAR